MLCIRDSKNAGAAVRYFDEALSRSDYYATEASGKWHGLAAARLGLIGTVERDTFAALMRNVDPRTGYALTPRTRDDRRPGTDLTFNAPKSLSIVHALTGDDRLVAAHRQAVIAAMREVERDAKTRVRRDGRNDDRVTSNIAWAEFLHTETRPVDGTPDMHLHTHAFVINATWDRHEQRMKALQLGDVFGERPYYEAVYHAHLAHAVKALGYRIARKGKFWDIAGVPESLLKTFSRRTAEIEAAAEELGITSPDAKGELGKRTRNRKSKSLTPEEVAADWQQRAGASGRQAVAALQRASRNPQAQKEDISARAAIEYAVQGAFERASVATEKSILGNALRRGFGDALPETVRAAADTLPLIKGTIAGRDVVTMREILDEETRMIEFARLGRLSCRPLAPDAEIGSTRLNAGQRKAIRHVWTSADRCMVVRGGAGTGKTSLMIEAVDGMARAGKRVAVFAPTSAARDVLRAEGFSGAETLQRLLADTQLQAALKHAVLWIDEAGLVSVPDMARLFDLAQRLEARIVLSGDSAQHSGVVRGDALRLLETRAGIRPAAVTEIVRQKGAYKDAVAAVAYGDITRGWELLEKLGAIHEIAGDTRLDHLAGHYVREVKAGHSVLVVSPTHAEKNRVTDAIRAELKAQGRLGEERVFTVWHDLGWTNAQKSDPDLYRPGQWVRFTQNAAGITKGAKLEITGYEGHGHVLATDGKGQAVALPLDKAAHFKVYAAREQAFAVNDLVRITENGKTATGTFVNGAVHRIAGFDTAGNIRLDNGKTLPADYGAFDYGYASTSVSAQGRTVDTVLVAMSRASLPATFLGQFYVTISRGRNEVAIYTDDAAAVKDAVQRSGQRGSAIELVEGSLDRKLKPIAELPRTERLKLFSESLARHVGRAARAEARGLDEDRELMRAAKHAAIAEYQGRVRDAACELGG